MPASQQRTVRFDAEQRKMMQDFIMTDGQLELPVTVRYTVRKTICLELKRDMTAVLRLPKNMIDSQVAAFLEEKQGTFLKRCKAFLDRQIAADGFGCLGGMLMEPEDLEEQKGSARSIIEERVRFYAGQMQVAYGRISVKEQKTRWGSCSAKGNLNFNWKLVLMPQEVMDYVVVHELAHRKVMNHSAEFWAEVEKVLPDYRKRRKWLKDNGV